MSVEDKRLVANTPESARQCLAAVRASLLDLHKTLLQSERSYYERAFGRIGSPYQFLHLLTTDPWFVWMKPVTQLIAAMDETLDAKEPLTPAGVGLLLERTKMLLIPAEIGEGFSRHYDEALQRDPEVVFAHAAMARMMRNTGAVPSC